MNLLVIVSVGKQAIFVWGLSDTLVQFEEDSGRGCVENSGNEIGYIAPKVTYTPC